MTILKFDTFDGKHYVAEIHPTVEIKPLDGFKKCRKEFEKFIDFKF